MADIVPALEELLALPDNEQVARAMELLDQLPPVHDEAWNSRFGPGSLFEAWTQTSIASGVHTRLAEAIRPVVARPGFVAVEIGAGNGRTWSSLWTGEERGTLVVIDPVGEAIDQLAHTLPPGVGLARHEALVQDVDLPTADLVVCSMTLHHLAGRDAEERAAHGLEGPGKREVLERIGACLRPDGFGLLVEADVDCDLHLPPGDPTLRDNLLDSYVRRCAASILHDLRTRAPSPALARAWWGLLQHWFLGQLRVADLPLAERDVYELRVAQWCALLEQAGLAVQQTTAADDWSLFTLYRFGRA